MATVAILSQLILIRQVLAGACKEYLQVGQDKACQRYSLLSQVTPLRAADALSLYPEQGRISHHQEYGEVVMSVSVISQLIF